MNELIEQIEKLNDEMYNTRLKILKAEEDVKVREAELWLDSNWPTLLNKDRPTEKDKTNYINNDSKTLSRRRKLKKNKAKLEFLKTNYEIKTLILKYLMETNDKLGDLNGK